MDNPTRILCLLVRRSTAIKGTANIPGAAIGGLIASLMFSGCGGSANVTPVASTLGQPSQALMRGEPSVQTPSDVHSRSRAAAPFVVALAPLTNCPALAGGTGLLLDGDFSLAPSPGGIRSFVKGTTFAPNWKVTGPQGIDFVSGYFNAPNGLCSVDLDGTPGPGGIAHTNFATTPGGKYSVSFFFSGNGACGGNLKQMIVHAGTATRTFFWNLKKGNAQNGVFSSEMWTFSASSPTTRLTFSSQDPTGSYCGPVVAGIRVAAAS